MCTCVYVSYLFHFLMTRADEDVTVMNLPLSSCLYGTYRGISYCRIVRDGIVLTDRSHRFPCSERVLSRDVQSQMSVYLGFVIVVSWCRPKYVCTFLSF